MPTYLALGRRRTRAAEHYAAMMPLVTDPAQARRVLREGGEVYAGDCEALALAYRMRATVRLEPSAEPGRLPAPADLAVVTPWYPAPDDPFAGAFVQASTAAVTPYAGRVSILHTHSWFHDSGGLRGRITGIAATRQAMRSHPAVVTDTAEGELTRLAVPTPGGGDHLAYADAQTTALRALLPTGRIEAPVVHAHTGMLSGVVAARLARPDARLIVTEHATFLEQFLARPGGTERYAAVLDRADLLLCVGRELHDQVVRHFPDRAHKVRVLPNAIDFGRFTMRPEPPAEPLRWLYLGRLMAHKGVLPLIDAFALLDDPRLTLTLVGDGPARDDVHARIAAHGLGERVTVLPPVAPEEVTALLHTHDLLVHASLRETFGMTVVEAVATGTPVLVAGSQGPAETLSGIEDLAGHVFEPTEDERVIAEAYGRLRDRFGDLDTDGARAELLARYGTEAVGARLHEAYTGPGTPAAVTVPEPDVPGIQRFAARFASPYPEAIVRLGRRILKPPGRSRE